MKILLISALFSVTCFAQNTTPPIDQKAPEIELSQLLQAPTGTLPVLAALRGKAVVLEFWDTWCGPCVANIPHLNQVAEEVKGKPVVFLSITDEQANVVQAFLKKRPISGWVGVDKDNATFQKYGIVERPQTILIDAQGILRATAHPDRVDADIIDRLISGQTIARDPRLNQHQPNIPPMELMQGAPPPLLQVLIRPASSASAFAPGFEREADGGRIEYYGMTLRTLLIYTDKIREDRIIAPAWFDQNLYDVSIAVPQGRDDLRNRLLQQAIADTFDLKTQREMRPVNVYVLRCASCTPSTMRPSNAKPSKGFHLHPGQFTGVATSVSMLVATLGRDVGGVEIVNETGLTGLYNFDLSWRKGDLESLQSALRDQLGLTLVKEMRNREFLVVKTAVEPKTW